MPDPVSPNVLPNQLVLPGFDGGITLPTAVGSVPTAVGTGEPDIILAPISGQGALFLMPSVLSTGGGQREPSSGETCAAGQALFRAACSAHALGYMEPVDPAHEGFDCAVEGHRVQVKATHKLQPDGRFKFKAGTRGRFDRYRDATDFFAFVIVASDSDLYGRVVLLEAGIVFNRWPGPQVTLRPTDFSLRPDLTLLLPIVTDKAIEEELLRV